MTLRRAGRGSGWRACLPKIRGSFGTPKRAETAPNDVSEVCVGALKAWAGPSGKSWRSGRAAVGTGERTGRRSRETGRVHRLHCERRAMARRRGRRFAQGNNAGSAGSGPADKRDGARPMQIERRNTTAGQSPYAGINFRLTTFGDPQPRRLRRVPRRKCRGAGVLVAGRLRRAGPEVLPQGRRRRAAEARRGRDRAVLAVALGARRRGDGQPAREGALCQRDLGETGVRSPRRLLDLLGLEGRLLHLAKTMR